MFGNERKNAYICTMRKRDLETYLGKSALLWALSCAFDLNRGCGCEFWYPEETDWIKFTFDGHRCKLLSVVAKLSVWKKCVCTISVTMFLNALWRSSICVAVRATMTLGNPMWTSSLRTKRLTFLTITMSLWDIDNQKQIAL